MQRSVLVLLFVACAFVPATQVASAKDKTPPAPPACPAHFDDSLDTNGIAPIGNVAGITQPKAVDAPQAEFSDKARKEARNRGGGFQTSAIIVAVVGNDGKPRELCVQKSADLGLDVQAAKAVSQYQFEPATKDGRPVAKRIQVEFRWSLY